MIRVCSIKRDPLGRRMAFLGDSCCDAVSCGSMATPPLLERSISTHEGKHALTGNK